MQDLLLPSPLQKLDDELFRAKGVEVFIKRDDLIHPQVQGNKWRKLKYNLQQARQNQQHTLLTFGGPYSNHIYATAAAARLFGFKAIGVIRGEEPAVKSATLRFAAEQGMQLHFISREEYRQKEDPVSIERLRAQMGEFYLVPEGGTNAFALQGVAEIISELEIDFDYLCTACGTGGTLAGLVAGLKGAKQVLGFSSLKGEDTLTEKVHQLVLEYSGQPFDNFRICFDYHFGGYAKVKPELIQFIIDFHRKHAIRLEPVYTGKLFYGLFDLIQKDYFTQGTKIIALHTGGLQGLAGFPELEDWLQASAAAKE